MNPYNPLSNLVRRIGVHGGFVNSHAHFDRAYTIKPKMMDKTHDHLFEKWEYVKPQKHKDLLEFFQRDDGDEYKYLFLPSGNWNYKQNGVWKCYDTSTPTKHPSVKIPDTSRFYNPDKQMFVYGFSKVSRVKELAQ